MSDLPAPLVPPGVDLRDFGFTPVYRGRLFGSSFHARVSDAAWRAGVTLWLKSWDQVPAGTLPADEVDLCRLAELGRDVRSWRKIAKEALHGWFKCSDGRMHHRTVAEGVMEAWNRKIAQRERTEAARQAKLSKRQSQASGVAALASVGSSVTDSVTEDVTPTATSSVTGSKGQGQGQGQGHIESPEPPPGSLPPEGRTRKARPKPQGSLCPEDFKPGPSHYAKAREWGRDPAWVDEHAERMKGWSRASANRDTAWKSDWSQALHNWLREHRNDGLPILAPNGRPSPVLANGATARPTSGTASMGAGIAAVIAANQEPKH